MKLFSAWNVFGSQGKYNFRMSYTADDKSLSRALDLIIKYLQS